MKSISVLFAFVFFLSLTYGQVTGISNDLDVESIKELFPSTTFLTGSGHARDMATHQGLIYALSGGGIELIDVDKRVSTPLAVDLRSIVPRPPRFISKRSIAVDENGYLAVLWNGGDTDSFDWYVKTSVVI